MSTGEPAHRWVNGPKQACPRAMMTDDERTGRHYAPQITGGLLCADCGQFWPGAPGRSCPGTGQR